MRWDEWRGSMDGRPSMLIKRLFERWGYRIDLHKFIRADDADCKHTHPATAVRVVLWGGYEEELRNGSLRVLRAGTVNVVRPELCHRIHRLLNGRCSYSLWLRGRKTAPVEIVGLC